MDWQALQDALKVWFVAASGLNADDVVWDDEPEGFTGFASARLRLKSHSAAGGMSDEVRYTAVAPDTDAEVRALGNRVMTFSIKVRTRDAAGPERPYAILERVQNQLELPSTTDAFDAINVGLIDVAALADVSPVRDRRREPTAIMDLRMSYASDSSETTPAPVETIGTIEHVEIGGTVQADGASVLVAEQTIP